METYSTNNGGRGVEDDAHQRTEVEDHEYCGDNIGANAEVIHGN